MPIEIGFPNPDLVGGAWILHHDITPQNIQLTFDGNVKLLDFGAARQTSALAAVGMTSIFSPGYSPFEQYHRHGPQGPWSDLYAMGSVLYWMVTGQRPVDAAYGAHRRQRFDVRGCRTAV